MIILGIDPGTAITGFAVLEKTQQELTLITYGCIRTVANTPQPDRLVEIANDLNQIIDTYNPTTLAIEKLFFSTNVKTAMSVSEARGVLIQQCAAKGLTTHEYTPNEIKTSVTGDGNADKLQMQKMVMMLLNLAEKPTPDDAADAIAIALCHAQHNKFE